MLDIDTFLKSQFQVRNAPAPRDRDALLRLSGQRWVLQAPVPLVPTNDTALTACMDAMLDQYLWFLPIPRFSKPFGGPAPSDADLVQACLALLLAFKADVSEAVQALANGTATWDPDSIASLTDECFRAAVPLLEVLRDPDVDVANSAVLVALMVLDLPLSIKLSRTFVRSYEFLDAGLQAIFDDTKTRPTGPHDALMVVHRTLQAQQLKQRIAHANKALASASEPKGTPWSTAVQQGLVSAELQARALVTIQNAMASAQLRQGTVESLLYVDSLLFEKPTFGFRALTRTDLE